MEWLIRIRKSHTDVAITAVNTLIFVFGPAGIKAFVNDFKNFVYNFDASFEVLICKIHFFDVVIASCETNKPFSYIDMVVLFYHKGVKNKLHPVRLENLILKFGKLIFKILLNPHTFKYNNG